MRPLLIWEGWVIAVNDDGRGRPRSPLHTHTYTRSAACMCGDKGQPFWVITPYIIVHVNIALRVSLHPAWHQVKPQSAEFETGKRRKQRKQTGRNWCFFTLACFVCLRHRRTFWALRIKVSINPAGPKTLPAEYQPRHPQAWWNLSALPKYRHNIPI